MRFFAALMIASVLGQGSAAACPLDDMFKLCVLNGDSVAALHRGADRGDWTLKSDPVPDRPQPKSGSEQYTMPSGMPFFVQYQDYKGFFSGVCGLDFPLALGSKGAEGLSCSKAQLAAFETTLNEASLGTVTKEPWTGGTAYLIEGPSRWIAVVIASGSGPQDALNAWVETHMLKKQ